MLCYLSCYAVLFIPLVSYCHQYKCFDLLKTQVEVQYLPTNYNNQEYTDTRVVLYHHNAAALGYKDAMVRTPRRRHICD